MKVILCLLVVMSTGVANAAVINDFTGPYNQSNWNITTGGQESVTIDNSPPSFLTISVKNPNDPIINPVDQSTGRIDALLIYETIVPGTGTVSFDWGIGSQSFSNGFGPSNYAFEFFVGDRVSFGGLLSGGDTDSISNGDGGHVDIMVSAGQSFGFELSITGLIPSERVAFDIYNFSAPVTEPNVLFLNGLGLMILFGFMRRQRRFLIQVRSA